MMAFAVHITASTTYNIVAGSYEEARELALSQFDNETFSDAVLDIEVERSCDPDDL